MYLNEYLEQLRRVYRPTGGGTLAPPGPPPDDRDVPRGGGETAEGAPGTGDLSSGGRISLAAQLDNPMSPTSLALALQSALAGPLGAVFTLGKHAMAAHNQAQLTAQLRAEQGPRFSQHRADEIAEQNNPQDNTVSEPTISEGKNPDDTGLTGPTGQGVGIGEAPPGDPSGTATAYHGGGVVRDRRPGMDEPITAQQGEYVVARGPAKRFRSLLEAINEADVPAIKAQARTLKERLTR